MAEEVKPDKQVASAEVPAEKRKNKKSWPTNCAQSNKRIRRKNWYYRNGLYFANKACFKLHTADLTKKAKEAEEKTKIPA